MGSIARMQLHRITKKKYARDLSGIGAKLYGGRWNKKGQAMLYTSENRSLALLELFVNTSGFLVSPTYSIITLSIPDDIEITEISARDLTANWRSTQARQALQQKGSNWLISQESLMMSVPSAVMPQENNYLINPDHADFGEVILQDIVDFEIDPRLKSAHL